MSVDRWLEVIVLSASIVLVTLWLTQQREPQRVTLRMDEWTCTDYEIDGCAEYRREHEHPMPGSARR